MSRKKKVGLLALGAILGVGLYAYPTIRDLVGAGLLDKPSEATYTPDRTANLNAIRTALMAHHASEDAFPSGPEWVAAVETRLKPDNMAESSALGKLRRPDLKGPAPGVGYRINQAVAGKYKGDLTPTTVLVYESKSRDAGGAGDPATDGDAGGSGITLDGKIVPLKP